MEVVVEVVVLGVVIGVVVEVEILGLSTVTEGVVTTTTLGGVMVTWGGSFRGSEEVTEAVTAVTVLVEVIPEEPELEVVDIAAVTLSCPC